jgi:hypothetical protein
LWQAWHDALSAQIVPGAPVRVVPVPDAYRSITFPYLRSAWGAHRINMHDVPLPGGVARLGMGHVYDGGRPVNILAYWAPAGVDMVPVIMAIRLRLSLEAGPFGVYSMPSTWARRKQLREWGIDARIS